MRLKHDFAHVWMSYGAQNPTSLEMFPKQKLDPNRPLLVRGDMSIRKKYKVTLYHIPIFQTE